MEWPALSRLRGLLSSRSRAASAKSFMRRLEKDISRQMPSSVVGLLAISLSRSDAVDAMLGSPDCDMAEAELLRRIRKTLREHDYLAFASADEVWVALPRLPSAIVASLAASNLIRSLEAPIFHSDAIVTVRPVIGIAVAARTGSNALSVLKVAVNAVSHARSLGQRYWVDVASAGGNLSRTELLAELQSALNRNQLAVYYQPKVELDSGRIAGIEALVRWPGNQHPGVTPTSLVDAAEQSGMIHDLTRFVLHTVMREYIMLLADAQVGKVWINLPASMLRDTKLPELLGQIIEVWGVDPAMLGLEVTESTLLVDVEQSIATLHALVGQGFSLAVDDFGTGYSSLAYLRRFPLSELKIDRVFIRNLIASVSDKQIVRTIIDLAHNFQLAVVAEGAEDELTLSLLKEMQCDQVQGYVYTKPLPGPELLKWISDYRKARGEENPVPAAKRPA